MNNTDEDIKILKELAIKKYDDKLLNTLDMVTEEDDVYILSIFERQAIEKILSEYKKQQEIIKLKKDVEEKCIELSMHIDALKTDLKEEKAKNKELETYKKIAYFLGARYWLKDCEYADKFEKLEDVLDWARKEVEKDD